MKTTARILIVVATAVSLVACGRTERLTDTEQEQADAIARGALFSAQLQLLGTNPSDYEAVFLAARDIEVSAHGKPVFHSYGQSLFDLSDSSNAWLVARFDVPKDATELHVKLWLDDYGAFEGNGAAGEVMARGAPIEFDAPVWALAERKHVVLHLDVLQSLVERSAERRVLAPSFTVNY